NLMENGVAHILIVDDEETILFAMGQYIMAQGCTVDTARELEEAQALLSNIRYHLVVADLRLSGTHGSEGLDLVGMVRECCPGNPHLSFNTHASTLGRDPDFPAVLVAMADDVGIDPTRITIEIIEHAHGWDGVTFDRALRNLRSLGARIALDDVGLGHSNYQMMIDTHPQYLKIDRYFVHGAHADLDRRAVLDSIAQLG